MRVEDKTGAAQGSGGLRTRNLSLWVLGTALGLILLNPVGAVAGRANSNIPISLGQDLYQRLSCHGCHAVRGQGGTLGPALDQVGTRLPSADLETQISTPRRRLADSRMPSFAFIRPFELRALLDYLQSGL